MTCTRGVIGKHLGQTVRGHLVTTPRTHPFSCILLKWGCDLKPKSKQNNLTINNHAKKGRTKNDHYHVGENIVMKLRKCKCW